MPPTNLLNYFSQVDDTPDHVICFRNTPFKTSEADMTTTELTNRAILAGKSLLGREIIIHSDADFTPRGKRVARIVRHAKNGRRVPRHIRWYVGGSVFRSLNLTDANLLLTKSWNGFDLKTTDSVSRNQQTKQGV